MNMNSNYSKKQLKDLRNEFEAYLRENHTHWSDRTVSTHASDAFFALNNNVGVDFWASLVSEESMLNAGEKIEKFLKNTNRSGDPKIRAKGYFRDLCLLKTFLDLEHPTLATDWSKKTVEGQVTSAEEPEELHAWIFQATPRKYNAIGAVENLDKLTWSVNHYTKQIKKGHKAYIWLSGTDGGIIASGTILCDPEMREPDLNDPYDLDPEKKTDQRLVVDIQIEHKLTDKIISRNVLKNDERTKKLSILIYPQGTNFPVKKEEEHVIESIIDGTYERIPPVKENESQMIDVGKNIILYGAPGTGKTYSSIQYAVAIIEEKPIAEIKAEGYGTVFNRYLKYKDDGLIAFTTFHQSFSYEEFIEGIRPVVLSEEKGESASEIEYEVHDGIFKAFCDKAGTPVRNGTSVDLGLGKNPTVWKVSLEGTGENPTRSECMEKGHIRIGWDEHIEKVNEDTDFSKQPGSNVLNAFYNKMQIGDIVMSCYSSKTIDAIGVVTGDPEWHDEYAHYKRLRKVNWLVKGINEDIVDLNAGKSMTLSTVYKLSMSVSDALQIVKKHNPDLFAQRVKIPNRVFIIDEINRGNISKIFGELITLIEPSKRINASEELRATLPYSGQNFGVPENVYIIGTMNTADRSIAIIDTALRRRFCFVEMQPESALLQDVFVDGINVEKMLETLNKRISVLLDRNHTIGHSYLLPLKTAPKINILAGIFENNIIPLLQEYFYDDYEKIQFVLGDNQKPDDSTRFIIKKNDVYELFGNTDFNFSEYYEVNREAFKRNEAYAFMQ
jgi:hypothetical protein